MGMFMASVAFRPGKNWDAVKPEIEKMCQGVSGLVTNLDQDRTGYAIVSPYGDQAAFLTKLANPISCLTEDYAVMATCVDSDFSILELYHNGELIEKSCIGRCDKEFLALGEFGKTNPENWKPLLLNTKKGIKLCCVLTGRALFAENQLRKLSMLTGLPIFDDTLVSGK